MFKSFFLVCCLAFVSGPTLVQRPYDEDVSACLAEPPIIELVYTNHTEVKLDGRPCKLEDIPESADIIYMELAEDKKTILKLHLRSKKR
jgi:hypothetical protein